MSTEFPEAILFVVDNRLHRGYRDKSGRFTLEQCNLSKASAANNLRELAFDDPIEDYERCEHCF
jgi:hypothetical protein